MTSNPSLSNICRHTIRSKHASASSLSVLPRQNREACQRSISGTGLFTAFSSDSNIATVPCSDPSSICNPKTTSKQAAEPHLRRTSDEAGGHESATSHWIGADEGYAMLNLTQLKQQNLTLSTAIRVSRRAGGVVDDALDASRGFALGTVLGLTTWVGIIALVWYIAK